METPSKPSAPPRPPRTRRQTIKLTLLALGLFVVLPLCLVELALRILHGGVFSFRDIRSSVAAERSDPIPKYHPDLGFVPKPGTHTFDTWAVTVGADSTRVTPVPAGKADLRPVLVVGDSFAFAAEVNDEEAWPAVLATIVDRPVVNAGMVGYGTDQAILRAEALLPTVRPKVIVFAYISGDIDRSEYAYVYAWKPYFTVEAGKLTLHNTPVPRAKNHGTLLWRLVGRSHLMGALLTRIAPGWWHFKSAKKHHDGVRITKLLLARLAKAAHAIDAKVVVLAMRGRRDDTSRLAAMNEEIRALGLPLVDMVTPIGEKLAADPTAVTTLFERLGHLSPSGNRLVAETLGPVIDSIR